MPMKQITTSLNKTGENCLYRVVSDNGRPEMIEYVLGLGLSSDFSKCETCNPVIAEYAYGWPPYSSSGRGKTIPRNESILEQLIEYGVQSFCYLVYFGNRHRPVLPKAYY